MLSIDGQGTTLIDGFSIDSQIHKCPHWFDNIPRKHPIFGLISRHFTILSLFFYNEHWARWFVICMKCWYRIKQDFIFSLVQLKKESNPWWVYKPCTTIPVFYSTSCEDWTVVEDFSQCGFRAYNSPFCISGAVIGFHNTL